MKKILFLIMVLTIIFMVGCNNNQKPNENDETNTSDETVETSTNVITKNDKLEVTSPTPHAVILSPVTVAGKSNFFETVTSIRIADTDGQVLAETSTMAEGWMDKLYPFSKVVEFSTPSEKNGFIEVYEVSAKDGSEINKITIPVSFKEME